MSGAPSCEAGFPALTESFMSAPAAMECSASLSAAPTTDGFTAYGYSERFSLDAFSSAPSEWADYAQAGEFSWEAFAAPQAPFDVRDITSYTRVLSEYAAGSLRDSRALDARFASLGVAIDDSLGQAEATPTVHDTQLDAALRALDASWTPTSPPFTRSLLPPPTLSPARPVGEIRRPEVAKCRGASPPTTSASSRDNSPPESPEFPPSVETRMPTNPFDLPSLLPSPSQLLSLKTPKGFTGFNNLQAQ